MKKYMRIGVSAVASLVLAGALCAWPAHTPNSNAATSAQATAAARSVSGKVASIGKNSFTLTLAPEKVSNSAASEKQTAAKSMTFLVDNNTTIDGKIQVGANADVTYREEDGNNIAISVRVAP